MRVAVNAVTDLSPKFGSRVYIHNLASELSADADIELLLIVPPKQSQHLPPALRPFAVEFGTERTRSYWQLLTQFKLANLLRKKQVDIYHLPNTLPFLYRSVPTIVTIHDLCEFNVKKYNRVRSFYRWVMNYTAAHMADLVITVSANSKSDIVRILRIPKEKVAVIHNAASADFRPLDKGECRSFVRSRYGISGDYLLSTGGLSRNKNVDGMLGALKKIRDHGIDVSLVLTGDSSEVVLEQIRSRANHLGIGPQVITTGHVAPGDLPKLYNACSLVLYPSLYEGFGLPVLESMACGAPIVTSRNSSIPEVAGNAALLVDPGDIDEMAGAAIRLLSDPGLREEMIARGFRRAAEFSWKKTAFETIRAYKSLLSPASSAATVHQS